MDSFDIVVLLCYLMQLLTSKTQLYTQGHSKSFESKINHFSKHICTHPRMTYLPSSCNLRSQSNDSLAFPSIHPSNLPLTPSSHPATALAAVNAAFTALFTPTVATGTPRGIFVILNKLSMPSPMDGFIGNPITNTVVFAATIPGRCAAPPAAAMMALKPRSAAVLA